VLSSLPIGSPRSSRRSSLSQVQMSASSPRGLPLQGVGGAEGSSLVDWFGGLPISRQRPRGDVMVVWGR
jgi:hypothetical protein